MARQEQIMVTEALQLQQISRKAVAGAQDLAVTVFA
jgi:hypothetical protein